MKKDSYANMKTKVTWKGELGGEFRNIQGNRQGGNGSAWDFKQYTFRVPTLFHQKNSRLFQGFFKVFPRFFKTILTPLKPHNLVRFPRSRL